MNSSSLLKAASPCRLPRPARGGSAAPPPPASAGPWRRPLALQCQRRPEPRPHVDTGGRAPRASTAPARSCRERSTRFAGSLRRLSPAATPRNARHIRPSRIPPGQQNASLSARAPVRDRRCRCAWSLWRRPAPSRGALQGRLHVGGGHIGFRRHSLGDRTVSTAASACGAALPAASKAREAASVSNDAALMDGLEGSAGAIARSRWVRRQRLPKRSLRAPPPRTRSPLFRNVA